MSPDGEWLAYVSDETGRPEIWVRPYRRAGPAVRLSANGGVEPVWAKNGRELYYLEQNKMMSVAVSAGTPFNFKPATLLFESRYQHAGQPPSYDVAADGRFLMIKPAPPELSSFNVLLNWSPTVPASH
jgi:serine/threonine-protein kinase